MINHFEKDDLYFIIKSKREFKNVLILMMI
jgi:hypothetical protein